ncbi:unnamed protein product [Didymodactylos carnosus]|uniref:OTU domain-containing protein n=1 Tax=Didymodactylos carnosus TaxID=1234261 RepID=A0A8S2DAF0_9BILA|nr:unnamed protein product [Didymodactylos carnosus]CAF3693993.1 unnamed protein product [Didymodactylos carnosus]
MDTPVTILYFACKFIHSQLDLMDRSQLTHIAPNSFDNNDDNDNNTVIIKNVDKDKSYNINTSSQRCTCYFNSTMLLPCLHILFHLKSIDKLKVNYDLTSSLPILQSTSNKNDNQNNTLNNGFESSDDDDCAVQSNDNSCCLTVAEKNRLACNEFHMINNYLTQLGTTELYERLDDLKNVFISLTEKQQLKKQAETETQTSLTTSPEKRDVNNVIPLFTITRVVHPRGRPKQTKRHISFYKRITSAKPSSKTKTKRLQGRPLSSTLKNLLMNNDVDLAPTPAIAPSQTEPLIDNSNVTHSQQSVSSNSSSKVTRSVAEAAVATITALEENENIMNLNTSDNQNHHQQGQLPSIPLPPTVITHDVNTTDDEAKENLCIITDEIIVKKMLFDPPTKEWIMKQLTDLKLIRTRIMIKDIKPDGNCLFRCLGYAISGNEELHASVKSLIVKQIRAQVYTSYGDEKFKNYTAADYIRATKMNHLRTWATEKEIFAACDIFKTEIFIFQCHTDVWMKWYPLYSECSSGPSIYLQRNLQKNHFDVVLETE